MKLIAYIARAETILLQSRKHIVILPRFFNTLYIIRLVGVAVTSMALEPKVDGSNLGAA